MKIQFLESFKNIFLQLTLGVRLTTHQRIARDTLVPVKQRKVLVRLVAG